MTDDEINAFVNRPMAIPEDEQVEAIRPDRVASA
jgi:hypothetical protein